MPQASDSRRDVTPAWAGRQGGSPQCLLASEEPRFKGRGRSLTPGGWSPCGSPPGTCPKAHTLPKPRGPRGYRAPRAGSSSFRALRAPPRSGGLRVTPCVGQSSTPTCGPGHPRNPKRPPSVAAQRPRRSGHCAVTVPLGDLPTRPGRPAPREGTCWHGPKGGRVRRLPWATQALTKHPAFCPHQAS